MNSLCPKNITCKLLSYTKSRNKAVSIYMFFPTDSRHLLPEHKDCIDRCNLFPVRKTWLSSSFRTRMNRCCFSDIFRRSEYIRSYMSYMLMMRNMLNSLRDR